MKQKYNTIVIGGGIIGCSILYQMTKRGVTDIALLEKNELTSGTTWHSAGNFLLVEENLEIAQLSAMSLKLFESFEKETGRDIGRRVVGNIRIARTADRLERYEELAKKVSDIGTLCEMIEPDAVLKKFPLVNIEGIIGAMWTPSEGYVNATKATLAFAEEARGRGAEIHCQTRVRRIERNGRQWRVQTDKGSISAENVILATGLWGPELVRPLGVRLPIVPIERQYIFSNNIADIDKIGFELPVLRDYDAPFQVRQEQKGLWMAVHEPQTPYCFTDGIPESFAGELFTPNLERASASYNAGKRVVPVLNNLGIRTVVCGATSRTADFNGLMGPVPDLPGLFVLAGFSAGVSQGAAVGHLLAEWIVKGRTDFDVGVLDVARFSTATTTYYVRQMLATAHTYGHVNKKAARSVRPARTSPLYFHHKAAGAEFDVHFGWECPSWFKRPGVDDADAAISAECNAARTGAGVLDASALAKYEISGPGAAALMKSVFGAKVPSEDGQVGQAELERIGGVMVARVDQDHFYLVGEPEAEARLQICLDAHMRSASPSDDSVAISNLTGRNGALVLIGPRAEALLASLTPRKFTGTLQPGDLRDMEIAFSLARVMRLQVNNLSLWHVHVGSEFLVGLYEALHNAAESDPLTDIGFAAFFRLNSEGARSDRRHAIRSAERVLH